MSAYTVGTTHIDAILTASLVLPRPHGPMSWLWPAIGPEEESAYERGEPWGRRAIRLAEERRHVLTDDTTDRVGAMLLTENRASVNHRYAEDEPAGENYVFRRLPGQPDPVVVLKALAGYEYQACEHPGWPGSEAHAFVRALERWCIRRLPGYDEADAWEVRDRNVFLRRVVAGEG